LHSRVALEAVDCFIVELGKVNYFTITNFIPVAKLYLFQQDQICSTSLCSLIKKVKLTRFTLMEGNLAKEREM
jgi:hypothetical protein